MLRDSVPRARQGEAAAPPALVLPPNQSDGSGEETRRNYASFKFIRDNGLYKVSGLRKAFDNPPTFPPEAIEIKANWYPVFDPNNPTKSGIPGYTGDRPLYIGDRTADTLPITEMSAGNLEYAIELADAFSHEIGKMIEDEQVSHLVFIEKDTGYVGTLPLMTSLVERTRLNACIYRLSHLKPDIALVGTRPHASARVVIVYDLLASGQAIKQTAMAVREITGAQTGAAVVLAGIGKKRSHLETKDGQRIRLSCLSWRKSAGPTLAESSRGSLLDLNWSGPGNEPQEKHPMRKPPADIPTSVPPGTYNERHRPVISEEARRRFAAIEAAFPVSERAAKPGPVRVVGPVLSGVRPAGKLLTGVRPLSPKERRVGRVRMRPEGRTQVQNKNKTLD